MRAWHFIEEDRKLGYNDNRVVEVGETYSLLKGKPELCRNGMHGSVRLIDALSLGRGPVCCRVDITGDIQKSDDKLVGKHRKVLWMFDATNVLHEFACREAEDALKLVEKPDPRSVAAIEAKRKWLRGDISDDELEAAALAAALAAWAAAWAATLAAWAATFAARAAARASRAAAEAAAEAAAKGARAARAAWTASKGARAARAAWTASKGAAEEAGASRAVRIRQNKRLTSMITAARKNP